MNTNGNDHGFNRSEQAERLVQLEQATAGLRRKFGYLGQEVLNNFPVETQEGSIEMGVFVGIEHIMVAELDKISEENRDVIVAGLCSEYDLDVICNYANFHVE